MDKQIILFSVPYQDPESIKPIRKRRRKKISQNERKKRGDFFTEELKDHVREILKSLNKNEGR